MNLASSLFHELRNGRVFCIMVGWEIRKALVALCTVMSLPIFAQLCVQPAAKKSWPFGRCPLLAMHVVCFVLGLMQVRTCLPFSQHVPYSGAFHTLQADFFGKVRKRFPSRTFFLSGPLH
jgi:hypothetical protein